MDIGVIFTNLNQYVFGSVAYTSLAFILVIAMLGIRRGWSLDTFMVVLTPLFAVMSGEFLPVDINPLWLFGVGLIISFGLIALVRR